VNWTTRVKKALEIDLGAFRTVSVDATHNRITVGGAVRFSDVVEPLWSAEKEMPLGGCSSAGLVGVALCGGITKWQGRYGLLIDSMLSVELVTASGELVTASTDENPELFWGMRGAGFNFGVVTSATFRVFDRVNNGEVLVADLAVPIGKHKDVVQILEALERSQVAELSVEAVAMYNPHAGGVGIDAV
jgi:fumiquinazoline A oxidase